MDMNQITAGSTVKKLAAAGRNGDTEIAHVTPGEIVVPIDLQTPEVMGTLRKTFDSVGVPLEKYTVASTESGKNPETGKYEYGFGSILKKVAGVAAPIVGNAIAPGIGGVIGGAVGSAINGQNPIYGAVGGGLSSLASGGFGTGFSNSNLPWLAQAGAGNIAANPYVSSAVYQGANFGANTALGRTLSDIQPFLNKAKGIFGAVAGGGGSTETRLPDGDIRISSPDLKPITSGTSGRGTTFSHGNAEGVAGTGMDEGEAGVATQGTSDYAAGSGSDSDFASGTDLTKLPWESGHSDADTWAEQRAEPVILRQPDRRIWDEKPMYDMHKIYPFMSPQSNSTTGVQQFASPMKNPKTGMQQFATISDIVASGVQPHTRWNQGYSNGDPISTIILDNGQVVSGAALNKAYGDAGKGSLYRENYLYDMLRKQLIGSQIDDSLLPEYARTKAAPATPEPQPTQPPAPAPAPPVTPINPVTPPVPQDPPSIEEEAQRRSEQNAAAQSGGFSVGAEKSGYDLNTATPQSLAPVDYKTGGIDQAFAGFNPRNARSLLYNAAKTKGYNESVDNFRGENSLNYRPRILHWLEGNPDTGAQEFYYNGERPDRARNMPVYSMQKAVGGMRRNPAKIRQNQV